jgi:hypothetical protein
MVRCKIKGTGKNRQGSPKPTNNKKKGGQRASTQPPPLELPPVTPTRMVSNSSASSSSDDEDAESVVTTPEPHGPKSNMDLLPLVGSSYTYYYDDNNDFMAHHDQTEEEMGFFDGSPFHLLEHELIGSMMDHNSGTAHHHHHHSTLAMAPTLPYASFRADGTGMQPRMKLQPRSLSSSGADFMASFIL